MATSGGRVMISMENRDVADGPMAGRTGTTGTMPGLQRPVVDRWMADLLRHTSGSPQLSEPPPPNPSSPAQPNPPDNLPQRLTQAVRWGYQERELARYEAALERPATFGELVAWARNRRGLTLEEIGNRAGLGVECIQAIERGQVCPLDIAPDRLARVADALDVSIWTVLDRLQQARSAGVSADRQLLPPVPVCPSPNEIWSSGSQRPNASAGRLCLKEPESPSGHKGELSVYCRAVYRAWREQQRETTPE